MSSIVSLSALLNSCPTNPTIFAPKLSNSNNQTLKPPQLKSKVSRRDAVQLLLLAVAAPLSAPARAIAFEVGISGPKNWLKEQKRKSYKFLLAPIYASRESLNTAYLLLSLEEVQRLLRSAARDCDPQERNSFVAFQATTGVEVCTFRLLVKNAASLLEDKDPVKLEAEALLNDLIRSFTSLNALAKDVDMQTASSRKKVADALMDTVSSLDKFEKGIKDCLEI